MVHEGMADAAWGECVLLLTTYKLFIKNIYAKIVKLIYNVNILILLHLFACLCIYAHLCELKHVHTYIYMVTCK